jgi:hypothetical protein
MFVHGAPTRVPAGTTKSAHRRTTSTPLIIGQNHGTPHAFGDRTDSGTTDRSSTMNDWIDTMNLLPAEREYVHFLVVGHTRCLLGVYEDHNFRSRWGTYGASEVRMWNKVGDAPMDPPPAHIQADQYYWSERPMREGSDTVSD